MSRRRRAVLYAVAAVGLLAAANPVTAGAAPGDAVVVPMQITGPPSERLNLVIMGDGYTASEMQKFRDEVDRNQNIQWSVEPFRSYRNYINTYRLEIESQDSGISCDPDDGNIRRNTPLRLNYTNTCPADPLARGITYGPALQSGGGCPTAATVGLGDPRCSGTQQHNKYLAIYLAPLGVSGANVQTLALANTFTYGGIGGTQATTSGGSPQGPLISLHELGHSLGTLADEYPYSSRDVPGGAHPNSEPGSFHHSRFTHDEMIAGNLKWFRWLCEESLSGGIITARGSTCGPPHEGGATPDDQRLAPERALDDALARQLLRPGRPREHDLADRRPEDRERDGALAHRARAGRPAGRPLGRDAAPEVPRAERDLVDQRRRRPEHRQQPQPRPRRPHGGSRRRRPGDGQGPDDVRPRPRDHRQRAADRDAAVDCRHAARRRAGRRALHDLDPGRPRRRRRRDRLRRDDASDRPRARRDVGARRRRRREREQPELRPRRAEPLAGARTRSRRPSPTRRPVPAALPRRGCGSSTARCRPHRGRCPSR